MTLDEAIVRARALPCWRSPSAPVPLEGGTTNLNLRVRDGGRDYVVRLGEDIPEHGVMRFNELAISRAAAAAGISPAVFHSEPGVLVIDYVESRPLIETDLHDRDTLAAVLDLVTRMHRDVTRELAGPALAFWVFHVNRDYVRTLRRLGSAYRPLFDRLLAQNDRLEAAVGPVRPVVTHNDLLPANILAGEDRLWLIDWEWGGFNSALFDLGGLASNAGLDAATERWMLERCFDGPPPLDAYAAMKCASLLRETLWSMVSECISTIDFDYVAYTAKNLERYQRAFSEQQP